MTAAVERQLDAGGTRIFVREIGTGTPVVLCNGIGAHVGMWRPFERALDGLRIVSFDAPGVGRSPAPQLPYTMSALARVVGQLFDALELERADVLGYSFGGALAQQFAAQAPERVRRLVLASTFPGWGGVPGRLTAMLSMGTPLRYYSRAFYELTTGSTAGGRARHDQAYVRRLWNERAAHAPSLRGYAQQLVAMSLWSGLPHLAEIQAPTLIVAGDDDPLVPISNALMMAARIPRARVVVTPGDGHFQLLNEQSAALAAIRDFLTTETYEDSMAWRSAAQVDRAQAAQQTRRDGLGAPPWGPMSAAYRQLFG